MDTSLAKKNFNTLKENPYPGRGLVIGLSEDPNVWLIVYWIMGRSTNSRNRRFVAEGGTLRTEPVDLSLVSDPSLIIYEAMLDLPGIYLASNGDQTRTMYEFIQKGLTIEQALATREREPDAPNYTPRISGILDLSTSEPSVVLSILKASPLDAAQTDRFYYRPAFPVPGFGYGLTTYSGDGNPLPSFSGDPTLLPLKGNAAQVLEDYWQALNAENKVSLAVKQVFVKEGRNEVLVKNRF
jgi:IMP cyclohydrolase